MVTTTQCERCEVLQAEIAALNDTLAEFRNAAADEIEAWRAAAETAQNALYDAAHDIARLRAANRALIDLRDAAAKVSETERLEAIEREVQRINLWLMRLVRSENQESLPLNFKTRLYDTPES